MNMNGHSQFQSSVKFQIFCVPSKYNHRPKIGYYFGHKSGISMTNMYRSIALQPVEHVGQRTSSHIIGSSTSLWVQVTTVFLNIIVIEVAQTTVNFCFEDWHDSWGIVVRLMIEDKDVNERSTKARMVSNFNLKYFCCAVLFLQSNTLFLF